MKRSFDVVISLILLIMLWPLFVGVAVVVRCCFGKLVLFWQLRPGKNGKLFRLVKFRTMKDTRDREGNLLEDAQRMTKVGTFLRASSLDELPELFNVLKGEMSLVGPRPLLPEYLDLYSVTQSRRHEVRPGITGWAQVNGRNAIGWEERFKLDVWYVDNHSFWLDIKILFLTFGKILHRADITEEGEATMSKFSGNKKHV